MSFTFVDLFAGIGGFHGALGALGGKAVYASEIDQKAVEIYAKNWGLTPDGDLTRVANDSKMLVPKHDVLVGGFPCQPFSKSGHQKGMDETRGTLFWNIAKIIEVRKPKLVLLENVRNLAGPRHAHEWDVIIRTLRNLGYRVSSTPLVVSPHRIHPDFGGRPQIRERIFIAATYDGDQRTCQSEPEQISINHVTSGWNTQDWDLKIHLPIDKFKSKVHTKYQLSNSELMWIEAWDEFIGIIRTKTESKKLPGFPIWADSWIETSQLRIPRDTPEWKKVFLIKNSEFYTSNKRVLDVWLKKWNQLEDFPPSRRKFEWQAQDAKSLYECIMHFRPSGIRAKKATYVPALVAITQTTVLGSQRRKISVREAARLQGLPDWFTFVGQSDSASYKQLGNGVNVPVVYHVLRALVQRDKDLLKHSPTLIKSIANSSPNPDVAIEQYGLQLGKAFRN